MAEPRDVILDTNGPARYAVTGKGNKPTSRSHNALVYLQ
jgi:hypothetical protein